MQIKLEITGKYEELKTFLGVVGMIDGSHIPMRMSPDRGIDYYNRKDFYTPSSFKQYVVKT